MTTIRYITGTLAVALTGLFILPVTAQKYPAQPIRIIVPFAAGGGVDTIARLMAQQVGASLGQPIIVENKPGAAGNIGADAVAKSAPDGYTILQTTNAHALNPAIHKKLPYDAVKDFVPVTQLTQHPMVLVGSSKHDIKSVKDFIEQAKSKPGSFNYGSSGVGGPLHLVMEMLRREADIDLVHVPYRGEAPLSTALLAGDLHVAVIPIVTALPHFQSGSIRPLAVTTARRTNVLPDVPTLSESGFPGLEASSWLGWFMPAGTPAQIVELMQKEAAKVLVTPETKAQFAKFGAETVGSTPAEFTERFQRDIATYVNVVKDAKIPQQE